MFKSDSSEEEKKEMYMPNNDLSPKTRAKKLKPQQVY